jgi:predicted enzyme related to lactoylglutathione lyase
VRDCDRALRCYNESLGLTADVKAPGVAGLRASAGAELVLHHRGTETKRPWLLQFIVGDIEAAVRALRARRVDVSDVDTRPFGKYARFADPDGNGLGLEQASEREH